MDFNSVKDDRYYCFGCLFLKDNCEIDYKALASELEEAEYYYAAMAFECEDIGFSLRMQTYAPSQWIFEAEDYEATEEDFKKFVQSKVFKDFGEIVPKRVQAALGALHAVDERELKANGIDKKAVDKIANDSLHIMTIVKGAFKNPKMKKLG